MRTNVIPTQAGKGILTVLATLSLAVSTGCETRAQRGALIGGAAGAGIGAIAGDGGGALIGGAIGAATGAAVGKSRDRRYGYRY